MGPLSWQDKVQLQPSPHSTCDSEWQTQQPHTVVTSSDLEKIPFISREVFLLFIREKNSHYLRDSCVQLGVRRCECMCAGLVLVSQQGQFADSQQFSGRRNWGQV
jgi:hypothetical protein